MKWLIGNCAGDCHYSKQQHVAKIDLAFIIQGPFALQNSRGKRAARINSDSDSGPFVEQGLSWCWLLRVFCAIASLACYFLGNRFHAKAQRQK